MRCRTRSRGSTRASSPRRSGRSSSASWRRFLFDSLSALSLLIAFYYGLTGVACAIYWRHELFRSVKDFVFIGVAPVIGAGLLGYVLIESARDLSDPKASYSGTELFGVGMPLGIAIVFAGLGVIVMIAWRLFGPPQAREFFGRKAFEAVPHEVAMGEGKVEAIGVSEEAADAGVTDERRER